MHGHKKPIFLIGVMILVILVFLVNRPSVYVTDEQIRILSDVYYIGNSMQNESTVMLTAADGKLYFLVPNLGFSNSTWFDGYLSVFENGSVTRLAKVDAARVLDWGGKYIFLRENGFSENESTVSCFDIIAQEKTQLVTVERIDDYRRDTDGCFWGADGMLYVPVDRTNSSYYAIEGTEHTETSNIPCFCYGDKEYTVTYAGHTATGIWCESDGEGGYVFQRGAKEGIINVFPGENGLVIHCERYGNLLYYIEGATGEMTELFTVPADETASAVNLWGEYVYISFLRYEDYDSIFPKRYENDALEGTYRISLADYSVEKLSDEIYNGLYIFDGTGIYACDNDCNIYKLDFDGQRILTLLEKR